MKNCEYKVLVIDDDPDMHRLLRAPLEGKGFKYLFALDAEEGKTLAVNYRPDLFIIDGILPDMTGVDLCSFFRANSIHKNKPIIFLSAVFREVVYFRNLIVDLKVDMVLHKPQNPSLIAKYAAELIGLEKRDLYEDKCSFDYALGEIRELYIESFLEQMATIEKILKLIKSGSCNPKSLGDLYHIVHRIHGAAGSYGFTKVSFIAGMWEQSIKDILELRKILTSDEIASMEENYEALKLGFQMPDRTGESETCFDPECL